jgi:PPOX class probable F420-dependent enzyme
MTASSCRSPSRRCTDVGVAFSDGELWQFLDDTHTGILTTLRADGWPIALPVWFVTADRRIYVQTPARTRKVAHVRRDPRVCFTAEAGVSWGELRAVVLTGRAHVLPEGDERSSVFGLVAEKYGGFGIPVDEVPAATIRHYDTESAVIRIDPAAQPVTWDNRKLRRTPAGA